MGSGCIYEQARVTVSAVNMYSAGEKDGLIKYGF